MGNNSNRSKAIKKSAASIEKTISALNLNKIKVSCYCTHHSEDGTIAVRIKDPAKKIVQCTQCGKTINLTRIPGTEAIKAADLLIDYIDQLKMTEGGRANDKANDLLANIQLDLFATKRVAEANDKKVETKQKRQKERNDSDSDVSFSNSWK